MASTWADGDDSPPQPEWNIKSDISAAQTVFNSGIPMIVAPLDVTAMLKLDPAGRQRVPGALTGVKQPR